MPASNAVSAQVPKTILIVEDDENIRSALTMLLEFSGYRVLSASNGREGLDILKSDKTIDLVLSDFMMPIMNGEEMLTELRSYEDNLHSQHLPVILVSAASEARALSQRFSCRLLPKPVDVSTLLHEVHARCLSHAV